MNHMKEPLHSRLFSIGIVVMAVGAVLVGSWAHAVILVAGLAAHALVRRSADCAATAPGSVRPRSHR